MNEADKAVASDGAVVNAKPKNNWRDGSMIGRKFGRLTILSTRKPERGGKTRNTLVMCRCDCGVEKEIDSQNINSGAVVSCGCFRINKIRLTPLHPSRLTYQHMIWRCYKEDYPAYRSYGARGIFVCDRWRFGDGKKSGYACFTEDVGPKPSPKHSLDRINNDDGYYPENCRWATSYEQTRNTRRNHRITINGETKILADWAKLFGVTPSTILKRIMGEIASAKINSAAVSALRNMHLLLVNRRSRAESRQITNRRQNR